MRNKIIITLLLAVLALTSSCTTISMGDFFGDTILETASGSVQVVNPKLLDTIDLDPIDTEIDNRKVVQINVTNNSKKSIYVRYRIEWFNDEGILMTRSGQILKLKVLPKDTRYIYMQSNNDDYNYKLVIF